LTDVRSASDSGWTQDPAARATRATASPEIPSGSAPISSRRRVIPAIAPASFVNTAI
jgi:hypothetical protein